MPIIRLHLIRMDNIMFNITWNAVAPDVSIFGFSTFISALALLIIICTITDFRYRFRVAITPFPLFMVTYGSVALIGFGTLITDLWFAEHRKGSDETSKLFYFQEES